MPVTERLYYKDSHLIEFAARVVDITERVSGWMAVTLDRTAFYPTGGGQPSDTGTLDGVRVVECLDEGENVLHVIQGQRPSIGSNIHGRVDWPRRLDHIQQHTGQHILSQAFVTLFDAPTHSFRVMEAVSEIDVELTDPTSERIERVIELANNVIWEDRPVKIKQVTPEEAAQLPLRKDSGREGELRLIEIEGFDLTPCGGTHANHTGEVGLIALRSWERAKGLTRIEFVAGRRALEDYRRANKTARSVAALFSAGRDDAPALATSMTEENKELHRRVRALEEIAARVEAEELLRGTSPTVREGSGTEPGAVATGRIDSSISEAPLRVITKVFDDRDADSLKQLAVALIAYPNVVALLGSRDDETARLVFARASDASGDMNALMHEACAMIDGRGGGKPDMAQGGGTNVEKLSEALDQAAKSLIGIRGLHRFHDSAS
jgi:alanyl-tRNA synthetase